MKLGSDFDSSGKNENAIVIKIAVVLASIKDAMPIDATLTAAHFDESTGNHELTIASDFWEQSQ